MFNQLSCLGTVNRKGVLVQNARNLMVSNHLVAMMRRNVLSITFLFTQFFVFYSLQCYNAKEREKYSPLLPIIEVNFTPPDDTFPSGTSLIINCTGKKSETQLVQDTYPIKITLFLDNIRQRNLCPIARDDTRPDKSCAVRVNLTKPTNLSALCQVENNYFCAYHETIIQVKAKENPYLVQQPPRHINATEGQDLIITCSSPVVPRPFITWYKNDVIVSSHKSTWYRGSSVLMLGSVDSLSQGTYTCRANNSLGEISSIGSSLTVFSRPRISLAPVNHSVAMGDRVSLVCNVTGLPTPLIGWLKDGVVLGSGNGSDSIPGNKMAFVVKGKASGVLSITPGANDTRGNDVIRNTSSSLSPTSVFTRPMPTMTITFARSSPPPTTIFTSSIPQLTHASTRPIPSSTSTLTRPISLSTSAVGPAPTHRPLPGKMTQIGRQSTLIIESVTKNDEGKYQCYAKNDLGNATSRHATLSVYIIAKPEKPRFVVDPRNVSVLAGSNSTLTCAAVGMPHPNITWYKNMVPIAKGRRISVAANGNTSVFTIKYVRRGDEGEYRCGAENIVGVEYSKQAFLHVRDEFTPEAFSRTSGTDPLIPILGTLLPVLLIIMIIFILLVRRNRRKLHQQRNTTLMLSPSVLSLAEKDKNELEGIRNEGMNEEFHDDAVYLLLMGIDRDWEVSRDRLTVTDQRLGTGCFGHVDKGIYTRKDNKEMFVAVKTLKDPDVQTHRDDILAELDMLKRVGRHPNVVSLVGACTQDDPLCIIIEYVEGGSLSDLLVKARLPANREKPYENIRSRLTERDLVKMAVDIARGMKHLHDKNCIHRDLAARNILIAPGLVAKISDFGLARHVVDGYYVKQSPGKIPWKWMAPEALQGLFTTKSDVWSYGILLWEIATLGGTPYPAVTQLVALYNLLSNGYRMPKPDHCHDMLYSIMMDCWSAYTIKRPEFADIYQMLQKMLNQKERIYINLEEMEEEHQLEHML